MSSVRISGNSSRIPPNASSKKDESENSITRIPGGSTHRTSHSTENSTRVPNRQGASTPTPTPTPTRSKEDIEKLMTRFRHFFPNPTRKALTAEFTKLVQICNNDKPNPNGLRAPLTAPQLRMALNQSKPGFLGYFTEEEFQAIFSYFDDDKTEQITLFEFTKGIRGTLPPHRQQLVDFVFQKLNTSKSKQIHENELIEFFTNSSHPEILSGILKPRVKAGAVLKLFGAQKQIIRKEQFDDYYVTKSLETEQDKKFRRDLLNEWLIPDSEADAYLNSIATQGKMGKKRSGAESMRRLPVGGPSPGTTAQPAADEDTAEALLVRFRKHFPDCSRNALTAEFKRLSTAMFKDDSNKASTTGSRPLGFAEFKYALALVKPEVKKAFSEKDLSVLFNLFDINATSRITLFEFVQGVRGTLNPFRAAVVEFLFDYLDLDGSGEVNEYEMLSFFSAANFPDIKNGSTNANAKTNAFFVAIGNPKDRVVSYEKLADYYITRSLSLGIEDDAQFLDLVVQEFNLNVSEVDKYVSRNYPKVRRPLIIRRRTKVAQATQGENVVDITVPEKDEEPFESLLNRFRKFFPSPERNSLTAEFKKLTQTVGVGDKKASSMSLGYNEFKFALASVKPEMQATFTERAIFRIFQYMDISAAHRVTLFEFVRQMRGEMPPYRRALVEYVFLYIDSKNDGVIDEQEVIFFYENSELPEIVNGTVPVAVKVQTFFKAIMGQSNKKSVKFDQLVDFYLTRSLRIESDLVFKQGILTEWNFTVEEVDGYVKQKYPNLVPSAGHPQPSGAPGPPAAKSNTPKAAGSSAHPTVPPSPAKPPASDIKNISSTSTHGPQNQSQQQPQLKSILKTGNKGSRIPASGSNNSLDESVATVGKIQEDSAHASTNVPFKKQASSRAASGSGYYVDVDDEVAQPPSKPTTPKPSFMRPTPGANGEMPDAAAAAAGAVAGGGKAQRRGSFGMDDSNRPDQTGKAQRRGSFGTDGRRKSVKREEAYEDDDESPRSPTKVPFQNDADDSQKESSSGGGGGGNSIGKTRSSENESASVRQAAAIAALESRATPRNSVVKRLPADAPAGETEVNSDGNEPQAAVTTPRARKRGSIIDPSSAMAPTVPTTASASASASASTAINRRAPGSGESAGSAGSSVGSVASEDQPSRRRAAAGEDPPSRRRTASKSSASAATAAAAAAAAATSSSPAGMNESSGHGQSPAPAPAPVPAVSVAAAADPSVESLRNLVGTVMVTVYEQRQDIDRLTKMIEGLVKVVQGKQSE